MVNEEQYQARIAKLKSEVTDLRLPKDTYEKISLVVRQTLSKIEDIDQYILGIEDARLKEIEGMLKKPANDGSEGIMLHLSHLDIFDLEKIALCAEGYYEELGGSNVLKMSANDLAALTEKISAYRKIAFPERKQEQ